MINRLDIVSFDIPYPANYGGVIDVFYRIKALSEAGVPIVLHCFQYNKREPSEILEQLCQKVHYYPRKSVAKSVSFDKPYIVNSRQSKLLLSRLASQSHMILFEGLHSCYYLDHPMLVSKFKIVRCMNVEHDYYRKLADQATGYKRWYYGLEARLLKRFEDVLKNAQLLLPITSKDQEHFRERFPKIKMEVITAFHGHHIAEPINVEKQFALFHGSLAVIENQRAIEFILKNIWKNRTQHLVIAGSNPSRKLIKKTKKLPYVKLIANPNHEQMQELIRTAHIHVMYATQATGLKLKLLNALFNGKHIIANQAMLTNDDLSSLVHECNTIDEINNRVTDLFKKDLDPAILELRRKSLAIYKDDFLAKKLISRVESML